MASAGGNTAAPVSEELLREPYRFDFFQMVRLLLLRRAQELAQQGGGTPRFEPGTDALPSEECVRFGSEAELQFPGSTVVEVGPSKPETPTETIPDWPIEMRVAFLGLAGAAGILPQHYTTELVRLNRIKQFALRDFFDVFNHRAISLFYRAWEKHRFPVTVERRRLKRDDPLTQCLYALVGLGGHALDRVAPVSGAMRRRLSVDDEALLACLALFSHRPRNAVGLRDMLSWYFDCDVSIEQLRGCWLNLAPADQSRLPLAGESFPSNGGLGSGMLLGSRVWTGESRFIVRVGPLTRDRFNEFLPDQLAHRKMSELTALYVGLEFDFMIQPVLRADEILPICMESGVRMGFGTWLVSRPRKEDGTEALFRPLGALAVPA
ncbi:MAG: type VI secretion system baseplate subunit TssG [Planctomycetota bacterium]|nr:type VI secretion system baseplate subunit TssG [Planctomycetota bacterium]